VTLTLGETWRPWHPSVRRGVLNEEDGPIEVLVMLAPWAPSGVLRARERAGNALDLRGGCVLPLLDIRAHNKKIAFIYESVDGIAASWLVDGRGIGHRAAAELVSSVAECVAEHPHPGLDPGDVLLCSDGSVRVTNYACAFPDVFGPVPPGDGSAEEVRVYRLGALLASLLGGPLPPTSTEEAHDAAVRRAQIRAMSRPGAVFSEAYGNWLRALLAWEPAARPPLSRVAEGLAELAANTAGPTLVETADQHFGAWVIELLGFDDEAPTLPAEIESLREILDPLPTQQAGRRTLGEEHVLGNIDVEDDPTVDSELGIPPETPPSIIERGSIPVAVGPPAEVAAMRPSLPLGFLAEDPETSSTTMPTRTVPMSVSPKPRPARPSWLMPLTIGLAVGAIGLLIWLTFL